MSDGELPNRDDLQFIRRALLLKMALSTPAPETKKGPDKPRWLQVLESAVVASLVTVTLGSIAGNLLVARYQKREERRAAEAAELSARLDKRGSVVDSTYALLADGGDAARLLVDLTEPDWQPGSKKEGPDRERVKEERKAMVRAISDFTRRWQKEKYTTGSLLSYYYDDDPDVRKGWRRCVETLDTLRRNANDVYQDYESKTVPPQPVTSIAGESEFLESIEALTNALDTARQKKAPPPKTGWWSWWSS